MAKANAGSGNKYNQRRWAIPTKRANAMAAELVIKPYEIKDEKTKTVVTGNSYAVRSYDENGEVYVG